MTKDAQTIIVIKPLTVATCIMINLSYFRNVKGIHSSRKRNLNRTFSFKNTLPYHKPLYL